MPVTPLESALTKKGEGAPSGQPFLTVSVLLSEATRYTARDHMEQMPRSHVFTGAEVRSMQKFTLWLAAALLMTGVLTTRVSRSADDGPIQGEWSAKFNAGAGCGCFNLEVERSSGWGHHSTWGNTHKIADFVGLDANIATAK